MTIKKLTVAAAIAVGIVTGSLNQAMATCRVTKFQKLIATNAKNLSTNATARKNRHLAQHHVRILAIQKSTTRIVDVVETLI